MLVLSRKRDERIMIGDEISLLVVDIRGDKVRLGIEAPSDVTVHRKEVYEAIQRERALEILHRHEHEGAVRATPYPGVTQLLERLGQLSLRSGVLTRNSRASVDTTFGQLGWTFDTVLTREDAPAKPDPTGVLAICGDWNLAPADVLFVGDYLFDLQAGHNAGTRAVLFVPGLATRPEALPEWSDEADWVVGGFDELHQLVEKLSREL